MKKLFNAKKEKKSKAVKKEKKPQSQREVAFSKRKVRKIASWLVFGVISVSLLFNVIHFTKVQKIRNVVAASQDKIDEQMKKIESGSLIESHLLVVYTEDFLRDYFHVSSNPDEREKRIDKLKDYFVSGFDVKGLEDFSEFSGSRKVDAVKYLDMQRKGSHEADVSFLVSYTVTEMVETEKEEVKKEKDKDGKEKEVKKTVTVEEEVETKHNVEIVVPIITNGTGFAVTNNPSLTSRNMKAMIPYEEPKINGEETTMKEREAISLFLEEFFTVYGVSDEKLAFMADMDWGLTNKIYEHVSIVDSAVVDGVYNVRTNVQFRDKETSASNIYSYDLEIKEENGRLFVQKIN